jgi:hypothetical protein
MNRILKRLGSKLRRRLSPDAPPLSSDVPPPDRMTDDGNGIWYLPLNFC